MTVSPLLAHWMIMSVQAVAPRQARYTSRWKHIHACRDMSDAALFALPPEELQLSASDAQHMRLCKLYCKAPMFETPRVAAKRAVINLHAWLRDLPGPVGSNWKRHIHGWLHFQTRRNPVDIAHHLAYIKHLAVQRDMPLFRRTRIKHRVGLCL